MSFLDPQSWTDVDTAGNPLSWTARQSKLLFPGYEMLRKALVERCDASGTAIPAILNTARAPGRIYTGGWFSTFHSTITTLISKFVNHTDSGGDWTGELTADLAPVWTEADILTEIGDPSRIAGPDIPLAEWSLQQYKILNELIWTKSSSSLLTGSDEEIIVDSPTGASFNATWAILVAAWPGVWDVTPSFPGFGVLGAGWHYWKGPPIPALYGSVGFRRRSKARTSPPAGMASVDWYYEVNTPLRIPGLPQISAETVTFDDEGQGLPPIGDVYKYGSTAATVARPIESPFPSYPSLGVPPRPATTPTAVNKYTTRGWRGDMSMDAVVKWDVASGFKFV